MLIRDIRSNQQLENAKKLQSEYLQLMIENEKLLEERVNNYRNPNKPPPVPPQYKSASEIQLDSMKQERDAIDNLLSLGLDYPTSSAIAQNLQQRQDGVANLLKLNKNFPFIKKDITERFNPKLLDSRVLLTYLDEVFRELDETMGLKSTSQKSTDFFQRDATGVKGVLPSKEKIQYLEDVVGFNLIEADLDENSIKQLKDRLDLLIKYLPTELQITKIDTYPPLERNRFLKDIERLIKVYNIPTLKFIDVRLTNLQNSDFFNFRDEINEAGDMNQGIEVEEGGGGGEGVPPPQPIPGRPPRKQQITDEIITELSILLNTLGLIDARGAEKLKEFSEALLTNNYNIERKIKETDYTEGRAALFDEKNISLQEYIKREQAAGGVAEVATTGPVIFQGAIVNQLQAEKKRVGRPPKKQEVYDETYLDRKLEGLSAKQVIQRFKEYKNAYPDSELAKYIVATPETKSRQKIIIAEVDNANYDNIRFVDKPYYLKGKTKTELTELNGNKDDYSNYLFFNIYQKDTGEIIKGEASNLETYTYTPNLLKDFIEEFELPFLRNIENYDPVVEPGDRLIKTQGFGLTNKIIKHFKEDNRDLEDLNKSFKRHMKVEKKVDDSESDSDSEKKKGKGVLKKFTHTRIKIGKGIELEEEPKFKTFGKYIIHMRHLADNNVLNVKFPSGGTIPSIKPVQIDDNFKDFIYDVLNSGKMNERHFNNLTKSEQNHFVKIAKGAKLINKLGIKTNDDLTSEVEVNRFELLKGEYDAGNNNGNLVKELRGLVIKFMKGGRINKKQGMDFLLELSIV